MVNRRFTQVNSSDDEEDDQPPPRSAQLKRKRMKLLDDDTDNDDDNNNETEDNDNKTTTEEDDEPQRQPQSQQSEDAKPIGDPVRVSGKGRTRRRHFDSFEFDGNEYTLEDPVLLVPEDKEQKPYVAIIKDIAQTCDGNVMVTGQWFYRPEEAEKRGGGTWQSTDTRELFYSFHRDEVPAEAVMHKCIVHFVHKEKQLPKRKQHPGFIVQRVYDTVEKKLWKLTDKDYEDVKQQEINELVQKTVERLGELPDLVSKEAHADQEEPMKNKRGLRRKSISPDDASREEEGSPKGDRPSKPQTPGNSTLASEHYRILEKFNVLTGDTHRDRWLEILLKSVQYICGSDDSVERDKGLGNVNSDEVNNPSNNSSELAKEMKEKVQKISKSFLWPDTAVSAVVALEKASHDTLSSEPFKLNQKLRSLAYNLKINPLLACRLLNGELEPSKILTMSPNELKEGLTVEETTKNEPDESQHMQMTNARCKSCHEYLVGLREIFKTGHNERYQLECVSCGHSWFAFRDELSTLTIDASDPKINKSTAPLATEKSEEDAQKKLVSPRESEKSDDEAA